MAKGRSVQSAREVEPMSEGSTDVEDEVNVSLLDLSGLSDMVDNSMVRTIGEASNRLLSSQEEPVRPLVEEQATDAAGTEAEPGIKVVPQREESWLPELVVQQQQQEQEDREVGDEPRLPASTEREDGEVVEEPLLPSPTEGTSEGSTGVDLQRGAEGVAGQPKAAVAEPAGTTSQRCHVKATELAQDATGRCLMGFPVSATTLSQTGGPGLLKGTAFGTRPMPLSLSPTGRTLERAAATVRSSRERDGSLPGPRAGLKALSPPRKLPRRSAVQQTIRAHVLAARAAANHGTQYPDLRTLLSRLAGPAQYGPGREEGGTLDALHPGLPAPMIVGPVTAAQGSSVADTEETAARADVIQIAGEGRHPLHSTPTAGRLGEDRRGGDDRRVEFDGGEEEYVPAPVVLRDVPLPGRAQPELLTPGGRVRRAGYL
jgi:hypothetical protein